MYFKKLNKVELHLHLDCSLSYEVVKKIKPEISRNQYLTDFVGTSCSCLKDYIKCADNAVAIMQTKQELEYVTIDLFEQLKRDNEINKKEQKLKLREQKIFVQMLITTRTYSNKHCRGFASTFSLSYQKARRQTLLVSLRLSKLR